MTFGKRLTQAVSSTGAATSGRAGRSVRDVANTTTQYGNLEARGKSILLFGEFLSFMGLLVIAFTLIDWPSSPGDLGDLRGLIIVPEVLSGLVPFDHPGPVSASHITRIETTDLTILTMLFMGLGLVAIARKRWLLTGLCVAFFLFPFSVLGYTLPLWYLALAAFAVFGLIIKFRVPKIVMVTAAILLLVSAPFAFVLDFSPNMPRQSSGEAPYTAYLFSSLRSNVGKPRIDSYGSRETIVRGITFDVLGAKTRDQMGAKAFVMAQEEALHLNAQSAHEQLNLMEITGFQLNNVEQKVADRVREFVISEGASGPIEQAELASSFRTDLIKYTIVLLLGGLLLLAGPLADIFATTTGERLMRIRKYAGSLRTENSFMNAESSEEPGPEVNFNKSKSILTDHADDAIKAIDRRLGFYLAACAALTWAAIYCYAGYLKFWLPSVSSIPAFASIALPESAAEQMYKIGAEITQSHLFLVSLRANGGLLTLLGLLPIGALFFRRYRIYGLCTLILIMLFVPYNFEAPLRLPMHSIKPDELVTAIVRKLEPDRPILESYINDLRGSVSSRKGYDSNVLSSVNGPEKDFDVDRSVAAYILAQKFYIDADPVRTIDYLERISNSNKLGGLIHEQRLCIMRDWARSQGYEISSSAPEPRSEASLERARSSSNYFLVISIVSAGLVFLFAVFASVALRRKRRLLALQKLAA